MPRLLLALAFTLCALPVLAQSVVPVTVGHMGADMDACPSTGEVVGLNPDGDNYLSVRAGPGTGAEELDRLGPGQMVFLCDGVGGWHGIVYSKDGRSCGVTSSGSQRGTPYLGVCASGWVSERYIAVVAG